MIVEDWMSEDVVTTTEETEVGAARTCLAECEIRQLPVLRGNRLVGIVTDRDLRSAVGPAEVRQVMTEQPRFAAPEDSVDAAARAMREEKINALPVVRSNELVGILTTSDVLDAFVAVSGAAQPSYHLVIAPADGESADSIRELLESAQAEVAWLHERQTHFGREVHARVTSRDIGGIEDAVGATGNELVRVGFTAGATEAG